MQAPAKQSFVLKCLQGDCLKQNLTFVDRTALKNWLAQSDFQEEFTRELSAVSPGINWYCEPEFVCLETTQYGLTRTIELKLEGSAVDVIVNNEFTVPSGPEEHYRLSNKIPEVVQFVLTLIRSFDLKFIVNHVIPGVVISTADPNVFYVILSLTTHRLRVHLNHTQIAVENLTTDKNAISEYTLPTLMANLQAARCGLLNAD